MKISTFYLCLWISTFTIKTINSYATLERIVYCTSSNKSLSVELCKIENKKFSVIFDFCKPINKIIVRKSYKKLVYSLTFC